jgi:hypothetical protein
MSEKVAINNVYKVAKKGDVETINVESSYQRRNLTSGSHVYYAKFTSSTGKEYFVLESVYKTYGTNTVTTEFTQKITGEVEYSCSAKETKTIGDVVTKEISIDVEFSNASGRYHNIIDAQGTLSMDERVIIDAQVTVDQNMIGQSGRYLLNYTLAPNFSLLPGTEGTWTKCTITTPNGTIIDPWTAPLSVDKDDEWHGRKRLAGFYFAWMPDEEDLVGIVEFFIGAGLTLAGFEWKAIPEFVSWVGLALDTHRAMLEFGGDFASTMEYENHPITVSYFEVELWCGFFPLWAETGYLTDQYDGEPLSGGDWWYIPAGADSFEELPPFPPCHLLSDPWPTYDVPDPEPVWYVSVLGIISPLSKTTTIKEDFSLLAQKDSGSDPVNSSVWFCGDWAGYAGDTFPLPPGTWTIQMEDYGALNHFDIGGYSNSSNPAQFTVSSNMTITAHYDYQPYNWVESIYNYGGAVDSPENLIGWNPDGQFTTLTGYGPYQYYGWIEAAMDSQATGHIYMYGYAQIAGPFYVYVSSNGYSWTPVSSPYVSSSSPYWIDCGTYAGTFNYIAVTVENPSEWTSISLDAVKVVP